MLTAMLCIKQCLPVKMYREALCGANLSVMDMRLSGVSAGYIWLCCCGVWVCVQISMMAPGSPEHLTLHPSSGTVRCLARQLLQGGGSSSNALMAVGTDRGGLVIAKPSTNNTVAT